MAVRVRQLIDRQAEIWMTREAYISYKMQADQDLIRDLRINSALQDNYVDTY